MCSCPDSLMTLPTECLLYIVDAVGDDITTLRTLLTINSFFFHTSLPRLVEVWMRLVCLKRINPDNSKLHQFLALVVASIIHYPREDVRTSAPYSVDEYFHSFGLQLTEKGTLNQTFFPIKEASKPIVDYTRYLTRLLPRPFQFMDYLTVMHQFAPPPGYNEHNPLTWAYEQQIRQNATKWEETQRRFHYSEEVYRRFRHMLLCHSPEKITEMGQDIPSLQKCLPLVEKMFSLSKLEYRSYPSEPIQDGSVQALLMFIRKHRTAFPQKPPLEVIDLENGRRISYTGRKDEAKLRLYHNHTIQVYEALVQPRIMDASFFPEFYTCCQHIDVSHLHKLTDKFTFGAFFRRRTPKDNNDMLEMFNKAVRLSEFSYSITDIGVFSKAKASGSSKLLPNLRSLELKGPSGCSIVHVLDDAMHVFGKTLKTVSASIDNHSDYTLEMDPHSDNHTLGGWNLPSIQHINLSFHSQLYTYLGEFNQCPFLTNLNIRCCGVGKSWLTDPTRAPDLKAARAPVWILPNMKHLVLDGTISVLFNYNSLLNMPNLETLRLSFWTQYDESAVAHLLPSHMWDLSELQLDAESGNNNSSRIDVNTNSQEDGYASHSRAWLADWRLPELRYLHLEGFPSTVFSFDWLHHCPKLAYVHLYRTIETGRRLPLHKTLPGGQHNISTFEDGPMFYSTKQDTDMILFSSPLKSLLLSGPWIMSDSDLRKVLTNYAPNLETLHLDRHSTGRKKDGSGFFQVIHDADKILATRNMHSKLTSIRADFMLKKSVRLRLGLVSVNLSLAEEYEKAHCRCARLIHSCVVRHKDWLAMKKRMPASK